MVASIYEDTDNLELLNGHVLGCLNPLQLLLCRFLLLLYHHDVFLEVGYIGG